MPPNHVPILRSIAANVQKWRTRRGLTQAELAERANVELRFVQRVEQAQVNFGVVALVSLAGALAVKPGELLSEAELAPAVRGRPKAIKGGGRKAQVYATAKAPEALAVAEPSKRRRRGSPG
jgi:transcriptional regulator with XRE-family HTH domain